MGRDRQIERHNDATRRLTSGLSSEGYFTPHLRPGFEADFLADSLGEALEDASVFIQHSDDLDHLRFDARETFARLAFKVCVKAVGLGCATEKFFCS